MAFLIFGMALQFCIPASLRADLTAAEVAVIANSNRPQSMALARHYIAVRGIPEKNLCAIPFGDADQLERHVWDQDVRPQIRAWLEEDPERKIRCLVTVWGVPLVIGPDPTPVHQDPYHQFLTIEREFRRQNLLNVFRQLAQIATDPEFQPADLPDPGAGMAELESRFQLIVRETRQRLTEQGSQQADSRSFENLLQVIGGNALFFNSLDQSVRGAGAAASELQQRQLSLFQGRIEMARNALAVLEMLPPTIDRDTAILAIVERAEGVIGSINWIDRELAMTESNETMSALDSELALIRWEPGYRLHRAMPNFLRSGNDQLQLARKYPTTMVARIDGPSADAAQRMVDAALAVEQKGGLSGSFYLDARGLGKETDGQQVPVVFQQLEQSLLAAGGAIQQSGLMLVVADQNPTMFQASDRCNNAALYCGWYSLGKYVDAFDFVPGAVGYHLSTIEAAGLKGTVDGSADTGGWCRGLLDDGCAVTIGAVRESGMAALPMPHEFFAHLVTEHLTVGESYWKSVPQTSWQMILVGDPLYRPFPVKKAEETP